MEKLNRVDHLVSHPEPREVISPELVLIDPELAEVARRLLPERPPAPVPVPRREIAPPRVVAAEIPAASPRVVSRRPVRDSARSLSRFVTHAIPLLAVGAVVLGMIASEVRGQFLADPSTLSAPTPSQPAPESTTQPASTTPPPATPPVWVPEKSDVEVRTLAFVSRRVPLVPAGLVDKNTGLLVNNVHVRCSRVGQTVTFTCSVGSGASPRVLWRLTVVPSRDGAWRWRGTG